MKENIGPKMRLEDMDNLDHLLDIVDPVIDDYDFDDDQDDEWGSPYDTDY